MKRFLVLAAVLATACSQNIAAHAAGQPSVVKLVKTGDRYQLIRNGAPYFIKGAGGSASLDLLKAAGGNSNRTWGADNLEVQLDEADRLGLTYTIGIWLGHTEQGFDYNNADQVAAQNENVRKAVLRYKDHPALLDWALGNEMEGYANGDNAAIWSAINNLAVLVKKLDPNHPVMTVISEIGGDRVKNINRLCPDVDIVGINSYGGGPSIPERYKAAGGVKPYILTEYGPGGVWETGKTPWGAPIEQSSTDKAKAYRATYEKAISNQPLCLGGYAFTWGNKQEATATWFGMLLPDKTKLGAVDALTELWSGKPPADLCPVISSFKLDGPDQVDPGATVHAVLAASDPEGDPLSIQWILRAEAGRYFVGGGSENTLPTYPDAIVHTDPASAEIRMPADPGGYRLFVYIRDGKGGAAVANIPLLVKGTVKMAEGAPAKLPLVIYDEQSRSNPSYFPTGWMGNVKAIKFDEGWTTNPHSGKTCIRCDYSVPNDWGGVVWQNPANDWGDLPGGSKPAGAKRLAFWARGDKGGETVGFQFGLIGKDRQYPDTAQGKLDSVVVTTAWKEYSIDVTGKDLTRIKTGFAWTVGGKGAPIAFYLDDIRFE